MEYNLYLLLNCFNRFANYFEKNNSQIRIKIEDEKILFCTYYHPDYNNIYHLWFLFTVESLKTQIEYFFFGYDTVNHHGSIFSAFEGMDYLLKPFGKPSCLEELIITMDLLGI